MYCYKQGYNNMRINALQDGITAGSVINGDGNRHYIVFKKFLGKGAFGSVFEADLYDCSSFGAPVKVNDEPLACKVLRPDANGFATLRSIKMEVKVMTAIRDVPHVASLKYAVTRGDVTFAFMDKITGVTLTEFRRNQPGNVLSRPLAAEITRQLLKIVDDLHKHNICHGDIKPDNIMVKETVDEKTGETNVECFLVDFGFSGFCEDGGHLPPGKGTPLYCAPEMIYYGCYKQSDLWSVGAIFMELISGINFYFRNNTMNIQDARGRAPITCDGIVRHLRDQKISERAIELYRGLCCMSLLDRYSPEIALNHPWFQGY